MSHFYQLEFVRTAKSLFPEMFTGRHVLEIGSLDINGSIRSLFENCTYTGLDLAPGPGVDVVCEGQKYDAPDASFDTVISCEVMEHNPYWQETMKNMIRMLKPGGLLVMSCAAPGRPEHGTTRSTPSSSPFTVEKGWDYYRNLREKDFRRDLDLSQLASCGFATNWAGWDLYMLGVKAGGPSAEARRIGQFRAIYRKRAVRDLSNRFWHTFRNPGRISAFYKRVAGTRTSH